jgi:hypothetical protein
MIEARTAKVWYSPAMGRRYFTKAGAAKAEARAKIMAKHPVEKAVFDHRNGMYHEPDYDFRYSEPERYAKMHRRMVRLIYKAAKP